VRRLHAGDTNRVATNASRQLVSADLTFSAPAYIPLFESIALSSVLHNYCSTTKNHQNPKAPHLRDQPTSCQPQSSRGSATLSTSSISASQSPWVSVRASSLSFLPLSSYNPYPTPVSTPSPRSLSRLN